MDTTTQSQYVAPWSLVRATTYVVGLDYGCAQCSNACRLSAPTFR
jgi:hypothetical protein